MGTSMSEGFIRNADGGAIVYFGCSRESWGEKGSLYGGPSSEYYQSYVEQCFSGDHATIGSAFSASKAVRADWAISHGADRWLQFGLNYQGDPAAPLIGVFDTLRTVTVVVDGAASACTATCDGGRAQPLESGGDPVLFDALNPARAHAMEFAATPTAAN